MFSGEGVGAAESPGSVGRPPHHVKTFYSGLVKTFTGPPFSTRKASVTGAWAEAGGNRSAKGPTEKFFLFFA